MRSDKGFPVSVGSGTDAQTVRPYRESFRRVPTKGYTFERVTRHRQQHHPMRG